MSQAPYRNIKAALVILTTFYVVLYITSGNSKIYELNTSISSAFNSYFHNASDTEVDREILGYYKKPFEWKGKILRWYDEKLQSSILVAAIKHWMESEYDDPTVRMQSIKYWDEYTPSPVQPNKTVMKTILYYNGFRERKDFNFGEGTEPFIAAGCPVANCLATSNRSLVKPEDADAVVWHHRGNNQPLPKYM